MEKLLRKATCKQLGGVCDIAIVGNSPEQMAQNAKDHVLDMLSDGDAPHRQLVFSLMRLSKKQQNEKYEELVQSFSLFTEA
jgi:hypothetical protein